MESLDECRYLPTGKSHFSQLGVFFFEYNHLISILLTVFITGKAWKLVVSLLLSSLKVMVVGHHFQAQVLQSSNKLRESISKDLQQNIHSFSVAFKLVWFH